jgi:hypothetical protein
MKIKVPEVFRSSQFPSSQAPAELAAFAILIAVTCQAAQPLDFAVIQQD